MTSLDWSSLDPFLKSLATLWMGYLIIIFGSHLVS